MSLAALGPMGDLVDPNRVRLSYLGNGPRPSSVCRVRSALFKHDEVSETAFITSLRLDEMMRYSAARDACNWLVENEGEAGAGAAVTRVLRGNHTYLRVRPERFTSTLEYRGSGGELRVWGPSCGGIDARNE